VLADPLMKRIYDKYGEYSLKNGIEKGTDKFQGYVNQGQHFKVFERFFGCQNPFIESPAALDSEKTELQQINIANREDNIEVLLECELSEFYRGTVKEVTVSRKQMQTVTEGHLMNNDRFNVIVQPGFSEKTKLVFPGRGHESFAAHPSDMVIKFS